MSRSSRGSLRVGPKKGRPRTTDLRASDSGFRVRLWFDRFDRLTALTPSTMLRVMVRYSNHEVLEGRAHHPEGSTQKLSTGEDREEAHSKSGRAVALAFPV